MIVNREDSLIVVSIEKSNLESNSDRCFDCAQQSQKVKKNYKFDGFHITAPSNCIL
jgi:hypothetical protein